MIEFFQIFIIIIIVIWGFLGNFVELALMNNKCDIDSPLYFPSWLYENTKMNWFGCWFCFILIRLLCPVNTMIGIAFCVGYNVCHFIKWLFTVGRKDD